MASAVPSPVAVPTLQGPIGFVSDLEGNLHLWECYLELSEVLRRSDDGKIELAEAAHFVFGGDAVDHYPGDLQILEDLLDLKRRYPDRVHLIIGNRDVNKLRLPFELSEAFRSNWPLEKHPGVYWLGEESRPSATMAKEDLRSNGSAAHLRWILSETLGARKAFENRRQELQKRGASAEDEDVVCSFVQEANPGGLLFEYLSLAHLAVRLGPVLFVHGGLPRSDVTWRPGWLPPRGEVLPDLNAWLIGLEAFKNNALDQVRHPPASLPKEAWSMVGGYDAAQPASELLQYMMRDMPDGTRQPSIIYNGFLGDDYQPLPLDEASCRWLREGGIRFVASGHLPNGDAPLVLRYEDVTIVSADISYAESVSYEDAESELPSGEAVCEVLFSPTEEQESRVHGVLRNGCRHSARLGDGAVGKVAAGNWRVKSRVGEFLVLSRNERWDFSCRLAREADVEFV